MPSSKPVATAILAVYNGASTIQSALDSLLFQSTPVEIIVVDDGSTDSTLKILKNYKQVTVLKQNHLGPATARNLGAKHAATDILLFVDADMTFDKHYARDLVKPIQLGKVIGTYTVKEYVANWDNPWARAWNLQEGWADGLRFPKSPPKWGTDYRAIKKSEFERVGGFDNIGYTDTWSLFNKLDKRPLATNAICNHSNPGSLSAVYRQAKWSAKRPYKLGFLGTLYALLRTSLPISLIIGISKFSPRHFIFKLVYDFGRFVGILEMLLTGKLTK